MAPAGLETVWTSVKKAGGLASIWEREKLAPVSTKGCEKREQGSANHLEIRSKPSRKSDLPPLARMPVVKGPFMQP